MPRSDSPTEAVDFAALPLYNTSFTLYRCSPLHLPRNATEDAFRKSLHTHTRRFADHLQREARLGLAVLGVLDDSDALARAGPLKQTTWTWESVDPDSHDVLEGPDGLGLTEGLRVVVEFERAAYAALLLRRTNHQTPAQASDDPEHHRLRLPLLFFRMPTSLRGALLSYLAAHFDARADPVHLPGPRLAGALEDYLATIAPELQRRHDADGDSDDDSLSTAIKDVQLTLSFPDPALRSLDVAIPGPDVAQFIKLGAPSTGVSTYNTLTKGAQLDAGPFTRSLAAYLRTHLALTTAHRDVRLARVACGGWAIATEGRVKIFTPKNVERDEAREIVAKLLQRIMEDRNEDGDQDVVMKG